MSISSFYIIPAKNHHNLLLRENYCVHLDAYYYFILHLFNCKEAVTGFKRQLMAFYFYEYELQQTSGTGNKMLKHEVSVFIAPANQTCFPLTYSVLFCSVPLPSPVSVLPIISQWALSILSPHWTASGPLYCVPFF